MAQKRFDLREVIVGMVAGLLAFAAACSSNSALDQGARNAAERAQSSEAMTSGSASVNRRDAASIRIVQTVPADRPLDMLAGDRVLFKGLQYKAVTVYRQVPEGESTFRLQSTGKTGSNPLAEGNEALSNGKHYTLIVLTHPNGRGDLAVFSDDLTPSPDGKAKVRIIHAAPDLGKVDVYVVGRDTLFRDVDSGEDVGYADLEPGEVMLEVRSSGGQQAVLNIPSTRFDAGKIYTIVITGPSRGASRLEAIRIEDPVPGTPTAVMR